MCKARFHLSLITVISPWLINLSWIVCVCLGQEVRWLTSTTPSPLIWQTSGREVWKTVNTLCVRKYEVHFILLCLEEKKKGWVKIFHKGRMKAFISKLLICRASLKGGSTESVFFLLLRNVRLCVWSRWFAERNASFYKQKNIDLVPGLTHMKLETSLFDVCWPMWEEFMMIVTVTSVMKPFTSILKILYSNIIMAFPVFKSFEPFF